MVTLEIRRVSAGRRKVNDAGKNRVGFKRGVKARARVTDDDKGDSVESVEVTEAGRKRVRTTMRLKE